MDAAERSLSGKTLCVFCGASPGRRPEYARIASALARRLARLGAGFVFGGGQLGLMGQIADAALAEGAAVTGIIPGFLRDREHAHPGLTREIVVDDLADRKIRMIAGADAFLILPGGLGTLDELLEVMSLRQLGQHDKPIVVLDSQGYFAPFRAMLDSAIAEGFLDAAQREYTRFCADADDCVRALAGALQGARA